MNERDAIGSASVLARLRAEARLSQAELAARAGCDLEDVRRAEACQPVEVALLERLAASIGVGIDILMGSTAVAPRTESPRQTAVSMDRVFVSHSAIDRELVEREIIPWLQQGGLQPWYSRDEIASGEEWERTLRAGLSSCKWFLLVMSPRAAESPWVSAEVNWAIENRWGGRIVPVLVEDCPRSAFNLRIAQLQYVDFRGDRVLARQRLLHAFRDHSSEQSAGDSEAGGVKPAVPEMAISEATRVRSKPVADAGLKVPPFHCGGLVPPDFFIGRSQELGDAEEIVRSGQNFLLIGVRRAGKSSFFRKLHRRLAEREDNDTLCSILNLESCRDLTIDTFLGHTILNMIGEICRQVFQIKPADLSRPAPQQVRPDLGDDSAFESFLNINQLVVERTYYRSDRHTSTFLPSEFVDFVRDLLDIVRVKGWHRYVILYDEANHLPAKLSKELLLGNIEVLESASLTSAFAATPEMAESFAPLQDILGHQIEIGPFESQRDLLTLLAQYYYGDSGKTSDLPVSADALQEIWDCSGGMPFQLQFVLNYSFQRARSHRASLVTIDHVIEAFQYLSQKRPDHFGRRRPPR
jgi:transcriptional regulator with XRE-family HTH domain